MSFFSALKQSPPLALAVSLTAATMGVTYGYDISNIAGALVFLGKPESQGGLGLGASLQASLATAAVIGSIVGALVGGGLSNRIGRKRSMVIIGLGYALFAVLSGVAPGYGFLLVARFLLGVTIGLSITIAPVFVAESSPTRIRGGLLVAYQVATVIGIVAGYVVAYFLAGSGGWRWMLGLAALPAAIVLALVVRLPDTPTWFMLRGKEDAARRTVERLDPDADVDHELGLIRNNLGQQRGKLSEMFRGHLLKATIFALGLGFFIQITGINGIVYYSPKIFAAMGFTGNAALLLIPAAVQFMSLLSVLLSMTMIDQTGRRKILLTGIGVMIAANALLVVVFIVGSGFSGIWSILGLIGIVVFTMGYTYGFGALVWVYAGEVLPARFRAIGASMVLTADLVANAIVAQFFPTMLKAFGGATLFAVFGVLAVAAFAFIWKLAPETKGRGLEEINAYWENGGSWPDSATTARAEA